MARDSKQFEHAAIIQEQHRRGRSFSVETRLGYTAIAVSAYATHEEQVKAFSDEATCYKRMLSKDGSKSEILLCNSREDFLDIVRDPDAHSIITIGNGTFSVFWLPGEEVTDDNKDGIDPVDWRDVARATTHLKRGFWYQRSCGKFHRNLNVHLGLFALSNETRLFAFTNQYVTDENPDALAKFDQVFTPKQRPIAELFRHIKEHFIRDPDEGGAEDSLL